MDDASDASDATSTVLRHLLTHDHLQALPLLFQDIWGADDKRLLWGQLCATSQVGLIAHIKDLPHWSEIHDWWKKTPTHTQMFTSPLVTDVLSEENPITPSWWMQRGVMCAENRLASAAAVCVQEAYRPNPQEVFPISDVLAQRVCAYLSRQWADQGTPMWWSEAPQANLKSWLYGPAQDVWCAAVADTLAARIADAYSDDQKSEIEVLRATHENHILSHHVSEGHHRLSSQHKM